MAILKINEKSKEGKLMLAYLKTMSYVELISSDNKLSLKTIKSIHEAEKGGLKKHNTLATLLSDLES
jgi:hypothetical protein